MRSTRSAGNSTPAAWRRADGSEFGSLPPQMAHPDDLSHVVHLQLAD
jgi:hypothetical protein